MTNNPFSRPVKVAFFTEGLSFGGINRYCLDLAASLRAIPDINVFLLAPHDPTDRWLLEKAEKIGIAVEIISGSRHTAVQELNQICRRIQPDILHTQGYYSSVIGRLTVLTAKIPIRLVNTVHGAYHFSSAPLRSKIWYLLDYASMGLSDEIISVSKQTKQQLNWLRLKERISVIHNGTRIKPLPVRENVFLLRQRLGLPPTGKIVCFVGRFSPQKGINALIKIMQRILQSDNNVFWAGSIGCELEEDI